MRLGVWDARITMSNIMLIFIITMDARIELMTMNVSTPAYVILSFTTFLVHLMF